MNDPKQVPLRRLQWLFPIAVAFHNAEEAIWMPQWTQQHAAQLPIHPPGAIAIRLALLILTLAAFLITALSARKGPRSSWAYVLCAYIIIMLANVFLPHLPAALWFRGYTPGVVTAVAINLPVMSFLAYRLIREGWVFGAKMGSS